MNALPDPAASNLAKRRWANTLPAERRAYAKLAAKARKKHLSKSRRAEIARAAAIARWSKRKSS